LDALLFLLSLSVALAVAYGLVYWGYRAETDRSARVGLFLVYGFPGILLVVAGLALTVNDRGNGPLLLGIGLGLSLPLIKSFRVLMAKFTPIDPDSPLDMSALCVFLSVLGLLLVVSFDAPEPDAVEEVDYATLVVQLLGFVGLSYAVVGTNLRRTFVQANHRLGMNRPTLRTVLIATAFFILALVVNGIAGVLTEVFQPSTSEDIQQGLEELTGEFQSPLGAVAIGVSAGIGEELFFRGALQPKFGIFLTSVCFALLHSNYGLSFVTLGVFGMGVIFGFLRMRYGTVAAMITHALVNFVAVLARAYS
jgi:membrane protease YdiL (CAAX protease family)